MMASLPLEDKDSTDSIGLSSPSNRKKRHLYRRYGSISSDCDRRDTSIESSTSRDDFPVVVSLETVQIGSWQYTSRDLEDTDGEIPGDIQLLYEQKSSHLIIKTNIEGTQNALPATYRISKVSAADLSLVTVVPNSLESMVVRLVLETDEKILYLPQNTEARAKESSSTGCKVKSSEGNSSQDTGSEDSREGNELSIHIVRLTASVHETGRLRDILYFHNSSCDPSLDPTACEKSPTKKASQDTTEESAKSHLSLIEGLPYWVLYVPWMFYSKRTRRFLQQLLFLYTLLSVLWALWQLYRHVNVIRVVIQPIIVTLRYYLSSVVELFDWMFAVFTVWWHTLLSPLNVLRGLLLAPMLRIITDFKFMFTPLYPLYVTASQLFRSSGLLTVFTSMYSMLTVLLRLTGTVLWVIVQVLLKPLQYVWTHIPNVRVAVQSMDFQRLRLSWVFSLVLNSVRSILRGLATFVGYTRKEKIIKKAMESSASSPMVSPVSSPSSNSRRSSSSARRRNDSMPMIYSSPLSKQH